MCSRTETQAGPVVRISPTMLSISEASMLPLVYHREADKTEHYAAFVKGGPESFFNIADHKAYIKARKVVSRLVSSHLPSPRLVL